MSIGTFENKIFDLKFPPRCIALSDSAVSPSLQNEYHNKNEWILQFAVLRMYLAVTFECEWILFALDLWAEDEFIQAPLGIRHFWVSDEPSQSRKKLEFPPVVSALLISRGASHALSSVLAGLACCCSVVEGR